ncbi:MAG: sodium/proline symporter PutP [Treponemataceae bacterium]
MILTTFSILAAFVCYLIMMIIVGWRYARKNETSHDFFLGGRNTGPWMTALSAEASDMSAWLLMGLPGIAYVSGVKGAFWVAIGLLLGTYLNWLFVAKRLRKYSIHAKDAITIPEFFNNRFNDEKKIIGLIATIFILVFFTVYAASGFVACAKVFNSVYGMPYFSALVLGVVVILLYTLLGGYLAVVATDFIQGTIMFVALLLTAIGMVISLGGLNETILKVSEFGTSFVNPFGGRGESYSILSLIGDFAWGLGYFGMPHILIRFMGLRSNAEVKISRRIATLWVTIALFAAVCVGVIGKAYLLPEILAQGTTDTVFIASIIKMFPSFIAGIFLCGIMAAAMSTADSQLLVASSAFSRDVYRGFMRKNASEKETLLMSRLTVIFVALIAFAIALNPTNSIFSLVSFAWGGFGSAFAPIILLSLFWRKTTRNGAIAGMLSGGFIAVLWFNLSGGIFDVYEILPGFLAGLIVAVIVSALDPKKDASVFAEFDYFQTIDD